MCANHRLIFILYLSVQYFTTKNYTLYHNLAHIYIKSHLFLQQISLSLLLLSFAKLNQVCPIFSKINVIPTETSENHAQKRLYLSAHRNSGSKFRGCYKAFLL